MVFNILALWDSEANVWWAESHDVEGLVSEAATLEELLADLRAVVPELLAANHGLGHSREPAEINLLAERTEHLQIV